MSKTYEVLIRESHLDSYGHVNNATYLTLFEEARWEIVTSKGYGYHRVHELQQGPVILEVNLRFMKELKLREKITITLELISYEGKIAKVKQQMLKPNGDVAAELLATVGLFDLKNRKLISPTEEWLKAVRD